MNKETILKFMRQETYRPLSFGELSGVFGVPKKDKQGFKRLVMDLVHEGDIVKIKGGRFGIPNKMNLVTGTLECHPDGFGFVIPDEGGEDVFVRHKLLKGAMHGDKVVVRVEGFKSAAALGKQGKGGKREGRIIRILERVNKNIVGRFERAKGFGIVVPMNERITATCVIPLNKECGAKDGDVVVAEVTKWHEYADAPLPAKVISVLGDYEDPDVEAEVIAIKHNLNYRFPKDVLYEARNISQAVEAHDIKGRYDLRDMPTVTIDGETAKDFDDAVSIEKRKGGGYRLWVSIADVSHYVKEGSNIDKEAFARGTSVYFPGRCIPMLPEELSNGICSLNANVDRLAFTAEMEFDNNGIITGYKFYESVIKSIERMTYTSVKGILDGDDYLRKRYAHLASDLTIMEELALKLKKDRAKNGSIDFDLPEPQLILDIEGRVEDIVRSERNIAHQIIEEFMLLANRCVAMFMAGSNVPFVYRVHERPDEEDMLDFREFISNFGYHLEWRENAAPKMFQGVLKKAEGKPEEKLINHVLLRSMKQARYSEENIGHFGLAFDFYTHFTSPIRRYPDLIVHRLLKRQVKKRFSDKEKEMWTSVLPDIAGHTSKMERNAMEAEREIVDLKKTQFMMDKTGELFDGIISGVTSFGFFVELKEYFIEGLVHVSSLKDDYYIFIEKQHSLVGERTKKRFGVGDDVRVKVCKVDIGKRQIDLAMVNTPFAT
ncbi:MAG: ribonuclease R [Deltaproteobacteria bacterium]|nr:ribonuclease R [Deltaproteobacteria bacterium]MBI5893645.1 ribonuclease R [Deltaproteobacteria bacterium]